MSSLQAGRSKKYASTAALVCSVVAAAIFISRLRRKAPADRPTPLHPSIDSGLTRGSKDFEGGRLRCHCPSEKVEVRLAGNVSHNHICGCSKCWKPDGALFSVVAVVPRDQLAVTANGHKLRVVDEAATIRRHACSSCGVHMYGRIDKEHPFRGLDFVHVELSPEVGWQEPQFAAFVSSVVEQGFPPEDMGRVRARIRSLGLETYDALSPPLMDLIAGWAFRQRQAQARS
ncbi:S-(hydroxymethyl)glutathione synthase [Purpureocillium takamizusanense]|uniref:Putative glutathione-dependent formaldehyde-activating enzyme n=1 Tax=Purpureocillium takamizusanense TaxID=2060973 RepID=A0A9Q8QDF5_9HYPO|nr:S-(hydroxymethyl)glutathione synthase [Purpureocillium takamizusanense]UNI17610.1 S-(hydroxymethyl)glutathione synthase [Purpureocillium takamizusanense]